jgi:hypothetical protein
MALNASIALKRSKPMQVVIQVILNVPDSAEGLDIGDDFQTTVEGLLTEAIEQGKFPGADSCTVVFEDIV